jgi:hypothetical protein
MKLTIAKIFTGSTIVVAALFIAIPAIAAKVDTTMTHTYPEKSTDISPLLIGESIPAVKIPGADGQIFDLNASLSQKPTILVFYRGG